MKYIHCIHLQCQQILDTLSFRFYEDRSQQYTDCQWVHRHMYIIISIDHRLLLLFRRALVQHAYLLNLMSSLQIDPPINQWHFNLILTSSDQ